MMRPPNARDLLSERFALVDDEFAAAVLDGLSRPQKSLPCRFFYDARGSELFEEITRLPEYYPTRTRGRDPGARTPARWSAACPRAASLVEFGSGSSRKTEILLQHLPQLRAYVMIDVSQSALEDAARPAGSSAFRPSTSRPIVGDFSYPSRCPPISRRGPTTGFFPGSTIGNFTSGEAQRLLRVFRAVLSPGGRLIVGVDLKKDCGTLVPPTTTRPASPRPSTSTCSRASTASSAPSFDLDAFRHEAIYNARDGRIEMHLVSLKDQDVSVANRRFHFRRGETHPHRELVQVHGGSVPGSRARSRLEPRAASGPTRDALFSVHELTCR